MNIFILSLLLVLTVFGAGYIIYILSDIDSLFSYELPHDDNCFNPHVGILGKAVLDIINDQYSPFYDVRLSDHLSSDIGLDSLDVADLLLDVSKVIGTDIYAHDLFNEYGHNPTVAQLIAYARSEMDKHAFTS